MAVEPVASQRNEQGPGVHGAAVCVHPVNGGVPVGKLPQQLPAYRFQQLAQGNGFHRLQPPFPRFQRKLDDGVAQLSVIHPRGRRLLGH